MRTALLLVLGAKMAPAQDFVHFSQVFQEERHYRIFLPSGYADSAPQRYPVVYFFHGFGERYNQPSAEVGDYDFGYSGDNLSSYASAHGLIIVKADGYNPRAPGEPRKRPYNECPYDPGPADCRPGDTPRDFPAYFLELISYIDGHYRTIADREHRGVSGVSIGGWMSYLLAWLYPDRIGSASSFMGSPEFQIGAPDFTTEWNPKWQYANYEGMWTRFITGSKDFIRWYHRDMHQVWNSARDHHEVEDFPATHSTPGIARTMDFHMRAFAHPLPKPERWTHSDLYPRFSVWGYTVSSPRKGEGFVTLADVSKNAFHASSAAPMTIDTDRIYEPGAQYEIRDGSAAPYSLTADAEGRLHFSFASGSHVVGIVRGQQALLEPAGWKLVAPELPYAGAKLRIAVKAVNVGDLRSEAISLDPGESKEIEVEAQAPADGAEVLRIQVLGRRLDVPLVSDSKPLDGVLLSDGIRRTLWWHATKQASLALGDGNGDGGANVGETIGFEIRDGEMYRGGEVLAAHPCLVMEASVRDQWATYDHVGATRKYSILRVTRACPIGEEVSAYVRFTLPHAPEHETRQGVVRFRVNGPAK